jgi:hypothetical protein
MSVIIFGVNDKVHGPFNEWPFEMTGSNELAGGYTYAHGDWYYYPLNGAPTIGLRPEQVPAHLRTMALILS